MYADEKCIHSDPACDECFWNRTDMDMLSASNYVEKQMDIHALAVETDTALAALWEEMQKQDRRYEQTMLALHRANGEKLDYNKKNPRYSKPDGETLHEIREKLADETNDEFYYNGRMNYEGDYAAKRMIELEEAVAASKKAHDETVPLNEIYNKHNWSRFFLVTNANGHIHSSMHCKTTFPTTSWAWLPALSGLTEKDAVDAHGTRLCSVCFPTAPVEWTVGVKKENPNRCKGSGEDATDINWRYSPARGRCSVCKKGTSVTNMGKARAHNK